MDAEAETPVLWPPDAKNWLIWKDPDAGKSCYNLVFFFFFSKNVAFVITDVLKKEFTINEECVELWKIFYNIVENVELSNGTDIIFIWKFIGKWTTY